MKLGQIFRDGVVFRHSKPIRIFGSAYGNVTALLDGEYKTVKADGRFVIELSPRPVGGPYELVITCGNESVTIKDVMIGEVLLFSGQSNIQFHLKDESTPKTQYVNDDLLRAFVSERLEKEEIFTPLDGWVYACRERVPGWSALAYLVGVEVRRVCECAVGLIICSQGASCIQSWINETLFVGDDAPLAQHTNPVPLYALWNGPGCLYHFMAEPLMPFETSCVVWLQGECNARPGEAENYARMLELLCGSWRCGFDDASLPFCVIGIHDFDKPAHKDLWKVVQDAQADVESHIPFTAYVRSGDICETDDIHPPTKGPLAKRVSEKLIEMGWVTPAVKR